MTTEPALCSRDLVCPSASERNQNVAGPIGLKQVCSQDREQKHGNYRKARQRRKEAEIQIPPAQPLPALRPSPRVSAQVRDLPSLLPGPRAQGRDSGRCKVKLVSWPSRRPVYLKGCRTGLTLPETSSAKDAEVWRSSSTRASRRPTMQVTTFLLVLAVETRRANGE